METLTKFNEACELLLKALEKAKKACEIAQEELTRPLTQDDKSEIDEGL